MLRTLAAAALAAWCATLPGAAAAATAEMFGALPTTSEAVISPDGKTIAMLQSAGGVSGVLFYEPDNPGAPPTGVRLEGDKARDIQWVNNEYLLLLSSRAEGLSTSGGLRTFEIWRWFSISRSTLKAKQLFTNEGNYYIADPGTLLAATPDDPKRAVFARWSARARPKAGARDTRFEQEDNLGYSLLTVRLDTGSSNVIAGGNDGTQDWAVNAEGRPALRVDYDERNRATTLYVRADNSSSFRTGATIQEEPGAFSYAFYSLAKNEGRAVATTNVNTDKRSLVEVDLASGEVASTLFSDAVYDLYAVSYDPISASVTGVTYTDDLRRAHYLDPELQNIQENLATALPGAAPRIVSYSRDLSRLVVRVSYTDHPEQFFLFDRPARKLAMMAPTYASIDGQVISEKRKFDYTASDGEFIPGYLTAPAGASIRNSPLIVLPHGGPASRSDMSFDWWSAFYAARGYLVYQPNFRGSSGYGRSFMAAGFGEWGRRMQDDITEGVKKLIADGLADPDRVCIVGASYGGYAALAGATLTPDLYQCAISVNGVTNLPDLIGMRTSGSDFWTDYWESRVGNRYRDTDAMREVSPAYRASGARAPIMLIVSRDDTVVPPTQSRFMKERLEAAGKEVDYVELSGEDHWLSTAATRTEMLKRSIEFIDRVIGPNAAAAD